MNSYFKTGKNMKMEKNTAMSPKEKMNRFLLSMGIQVSVFALIVYTALNPESWTSTVLFIYVCFIGIVAAVALLITYATSKIPAEEAKKIAKQGRDYQYVQSPTALLAHYISMVFTFLEVGVFLYVGWYWYALVWIVADVIQSKIMRNVRSMETA